MTPDDQDDITQFEKLFQIHYANLCSYAIRYVKSHDLAEDIVSETFYTLWKAKENFPKIDNLKSYLFKSVHNNCLYYLRSEKSHSTIHHFDFTTLDFERTETKDAMDTLMLKELSDQLEAAISRLPEQQQKVFRMKRFENRKNKEIAEELNLSVKTVEMHMSKAVSRLREDLKTLLPSFIIAFLLGM